VFRNEVFMKAVSRAFGRRIVRPLFGCALRLQATLAKGQEGSLDWRCYFEESGKRISPWHDISMRAPSPCGGFHFVNEIPRKCAAATAPLTRSTTAKFEISTREAFNPIVQDRKGEKLRSITPPPSILT
jgi:hypothetical protein